MERKIQFKSIFCRGGGLPVLVKYQQKKQTWMESKWGQSVVGYSRRPLHREITFISSRHFWVWGPFTFMIASVWRPQRHDEDDDDYNNTTKSLFSPLPLHKHTNIHAYIHTYAYRIIHVCVLFFRFFGHWVKKEALNDNKTQAYLLTAFIIQKYTNVFYNLQNVKIIPIS